MNIGPSDRGGSGQAKRPSKIEMAAHDQLPPMIRLACNHSPRLPSSVEVLRSWNERRLNGKTEIEFLADLHMASLAKCGRSFVQDW